MIDTACDLDHARQGYTVIFDRLRLVHPASTRWLYSCVES